MIEAIVSVAAKQARRETVASHVMQVRSKMFVVGMEGACTNAVILLIILQYLENKKT